MYKKNVDLVLVFFISSLLIFNLVILYSASNKNVNLLNKTITNIIIGIIIMFIMSKISYKIYNLISPLVYFMSIFLLILVYFFGNINKGAYRWLKVGFIKFQPSEITKISVPLMLTYFIRKNKNCYSLKNLFISLIIIFTPCVLIAIQPDLGTSVLIMFSGLIVLFMHGIKYKHILYIVLFLLFSFFINWNFFMKNYQKNRILVLLNPELNPRKEGYHIIQSKIAVGSGGIFGRGLFKGTQSRLKFIPESHTDFIFSVIAEELGLIGVLLLLFLYLGFIFKIIFIAIKNKNIFCKVLITSFILTIFFSIFINISMVIGLIPVVGIPLPLISYGGSSLIVIFIKIGIILSLNSNNNNINFKDID